MIWTILFVMLGLYLGGVIQRAAAALTPTPGDDAAALLTIAILAALLAIPFLAPLWIYGLALAGVAGAFVTWATGIQEGATVGRAPLWPVDLWRGVKSWLNEIVE